MHILFLFIHGAFEILLYLLTEQVWVDLWSQFWLLQFCTSVWIHITATYAFLTASYPRSKRHQNPKGLAIKWVSTQLLQRERLSGLGQKTMDTKNDTKDTMDPNSKKNSAAS